MSLSVLADMHVRIREPAGTGRRLTTRAGRPVMIAGAARLANTGTDAAKAMTNRGCQVRGEGGGCKEACGEGKMRGLVALVAWCREAV